MIFNREMKTKKVRFKKQDFIIQHKHPFIHLGADPLIVFPFIQSPIVTETKKKDVENSK